MLSGVRENFPRSIKKTKPLSFFNISINQYSKGNMRENAGSVLVATMNYCSEVVTHTVYPSLGM